MNNSSKRTLLRLLTAAAVLLTTFASAHPQRGKFNPDGTFWIIGEPPPAFKDFSGIHLNASKNPRFNKPGVDLTDGRSFRFRTLTVNRENLIFTTQTVRGRAYTFKGKFLRGGTFASYDLEGVAVLEGTLTKLSGGKVVSEAKLKFAYFGGT